MEVCERWQHKFKWFVHILLTNLHSNIFDVAILWNRSAYYVLRSSNTLKFKGQFLHRQLSANCAASLFLWGVLELKLQYTYSRRETKKKSLRSLAEIFVWDIFVSTELNWEVDTWLFVKKLALIHEILRFCRWNFPRFLLENSGVFSRKLISNVYIRIFIEIEWYLTIGWCWRESHDNIYNLERYL